MALYLDRVKHQDIDTLLKITHFDDESRLLLTLSAAKYLHSGISLNEKNINFCKVSIFNKDKNGLGYRYIEINDNIKNVCTKISNYIGPRKKPDIILPYYTCYSWDIPNIFLYNHFIMSMMK